MKIIISHSFDGKPSAIHYNRGIRDDSMWAALPFNPETKTFNPQSDIDKQLLAEAQALPEWADLDLSDRPPTLQIPLAPNWVGVLEAVRGTILFGKVYTASKSSVEINTVFTLLLTALTNPYPNLLDFIFALQELQKVMGNAMTIEDINTINTALKNNNFDFQINTETTSTSNT